MSGIQVVAGFEVIAASAATANLTGVEFGAMLSLHRVNGIQETIMNVITGKKLSRDFF